MKPDPVIDSVRAARHAISERHGHDPKRLIEYYQERQKALADRLVGHKKEPEIEDEA